MLFRKMMEQGQSLSWQRVLKQLFDYDDIKSEPLMNYYKPLENWLRKEVKRLQIPLGW